MCSKITPESWYYRGEGNANIAIALNSYKILRVRKSEKSNNFLKRIIDYILRFFGLDYESKLEMKSLKFYNELMVPIMGKFASPGLPVYITKETVAKFNKVLSNIRPEFRKHKTVQHGKAALFSDYAFLSKSYEELYPNISTYSVEIKPKQAATLESNCQFCLNQHLKLHKRQIKEISNYCPLDLFSGDIPRMKKSLKALIANPQNNFKLFKNGQLVYGDGIDINQFYQFLQQVFDSNDKLEDFCELLISILLKPIDLHNNNFCLKCERLSSLPLGCILQRIYLLQTFDQRGLSENLKCYQLIKPSDWNYIDKILNNLNRTNESCLRCFMNNCHKDIIFVPYIISSIANDCSFMVTFKKVLESNVDCVNLGPLKFLTNVGALDLYPKPASVIQKHQLRNNKIKQLCI